MPAAGSYVIAAYMAVPIVLMIVAPALIGLVIAGLDYYATNYAKTDRIQALFVKNREGECRV